MRRIIIVALLTGLLPTTSTRSQPPTGRNCMPTGYTMICRTTCIFAYGFGGLCSSEGEEPPGSYCLQTMGVDPWNSCHDGSSEECCAGAPAL